MGLFEDEGRGNFRVGERGLIFKLGKMNYLLNGLICNKYTIHFNNFITSFQRGLFRGIARTATKKQCHIGYLQKAVVKKLVLCGAM